MTKDEAKTKVNLLRSKGLRWDEITTELKNSGFKSRHTRKPLGVNSVRQLIAPPNRMAPEAKAPKRIEQKIAASTKTDFPKRGNKMWFHFVTSFLSRKEQLRLAADIINQPW